MIGKKGLVFSRLYYWIFDIFLLLVIFGSVGYYATVNADDTGFKQQFYARDIALLIDEMLSTQGAISVNYTLEEDFLVQVYQGEVGVFKENLKEKFKFAVPARYPYMQLHGFDVATSFDEKNHVLVFMKVRT